MFLPFKLLLNFGEPRRGILCLRSSPCRLRPRRRPSVPGGTAFRPPRLFGAGRKSSPLSACSSARTGSRLSESVGSDKRFIFFIRLTGPETPVCSPPDRNTGATCSVSPGSRCHRSGSTAPLGSPWIPPDSPEWNNRAQFYSGLSINRSQMPY